MYKTFLFCYCSNNERRKFLSEYFINSILSTFMGRGREEEGLVCKSGYISRMCRIRRLRSLQDHDSLILPKYFSRWGRKRENCRKIAWRKISEKESKKQSVKCTLTSSNEILLVVYRISERSLLLTYNLSFSFTEVSNP